MSTKLTITLTPQLHGSEAYSTVYMLECNSSHSMFQSLTLVQRVCVRARYQVGSRCNTDFYLCLAKDRAVSRVLAVLQLRLKFIVLCEVTSQIMHTSIMCMPMTFTQSSRLEK